MPRPRTLALAAFSTLVLGTLGTFATVRVEHEMRLRELGTLVPTLDGELARHLVEDSPTKWHEYCRRSGPRVLMLGVTAIYRSLTPMPWARFVRERRKLEAVSHRMGDALEREFGYGVCTARARHVCEWSDSVDYVCHQISARYVATLADSTSSSAVRLARLDDLIARADSIRNPLQSMSMQGSAAHLELEAGHPDRHYQRLSRALFEARRLGDDYFACQMLGELAIRHYMVDEDDSARACLDEAIVRARRHHFPDQTGRLELFAARHAAGDGRLALAAADLDDAREVAAEFGGGSAGLRPTLEYAELLAELGCWDEVQRLVSALPPLERQFPSRLEATEAGAYRFHADLLRARVAFVENRADDGSRILEPWLRSLPVSERRTGLAELLDDWSWGLLISGRLAEALAVCEQGAAHSDSAHVVELQPRFELRRARLLEGLARIADASVALANATRMVDEPRVPPGMLELALVVEQARLTFVSGDAGAGRRLVRRAFDERAHFNESGKRDALLHWRDFDGLSLRDAVHERAALAPAAGYGFELAWRSLDLEPRGEPERGAFDPIAERAPATTGIHLVYHFLGNRLLRWTATRDGVVLDTLDFSSRRCLADVRRAVRLLQEAPAAPGGVLETHAQAVLESLATVLLPRELLRADALTRLEISSDGPLAALPFEALPVHTRNGPVPLAARVPIDYVRGWRAPQSAGAGRTLIVSNPALDPELQSRFAWAGPLRGSDAESRSACTRWPDALVLSGPQATKGAFLANAPRAANIYVAAHHVRDPGAPFLGFVPMAAPPGSAPGVAWLEAADIRRLDLSSCRLAVLASCSSGAPYRSALEPGASLGDAFIAAGAHAVVQSCWDVGDDETRVFMERFLRFDRSARTVDDDVRALAEARRAAMADGAPPRVWAAWSIACTRPRDPVRGAPELVFTSKGSPERR